MNAENFLGIKAPSYKSTLVGKSCSGEMRLDNGLYFILAINFFWCLTHNFAVKVSLIYI